MSDIVRTVTIEHPDLDEPIRAVDAAPALVVGATVYQPHGFRVRLGARADAGATGHVTLDAVDPAIIAALHTLSGMASPRVIIEAWDREDVGGGAIARCAMTISAVGQSGPRVAEVTLAPETWDAAEPLSVMMTPGRFPALFA